MKPIVAIVGRPNVGKSTLFNRLIGARQAIVEDIPGTTRDRIYGDADWAGRVFSVVDTGGIATDDEDVFTALIEEQAQQAVEDADVIVFMVDARAGVSQADADVAERLRRAEKPVILVANKADTEEQLHASVDFYELGLGEPLAVSASHGLGIGDLLDAVVGRLPAELQEDEQDVFKVAIVGRPNVGKSSLLNALLGEERSIVSEVPGTTRDAIDTPIEYEGEQLVLIDTAGIRRRGRVEQGIEKYSVIRSLRAIDRCDAACLVVDAGEMLTAQDVHIAGYVRDASKGLLLVVNKWDLIPKTETTITEYQDEIKRQLNFADWAPSVFISAKTGQRVERVLRAVLKIKEERAKKVSTSELNHIVAEATRRHHPPGDKGRQLKLFYATQAGINPPTFLFFVNDPKLSHWSYMRYLENQLRERLGFEGTAIKLALKARSD
ncbi:MAG TPA: ribosome biogenesis GTPase Der [Chloroflexota bacterium]|jgi:GTP-binding protein|nr:ribosome biogenesis GTPase Der [Chloroflexota bacterium]